MEMTVPIVAYGTRRKVRHRQGVLRMKSIRDCGLAWPLMFKSTNTVGALPLIDEVPHVFPEFTQASYANLVPQNPSWLPVDHAGSAIAEIVTREQPLSKSEVYHIVNPNVSVGWSEILDGLEAAGLRFDRVDIQTWLERLAKSDQDGERNPSIKLLASHLYLRSRVY